MRERCHQPRVRFARPHHAPGLEWSAYRPLLPDWEIVAGDPTAPGALDGVDVLVATAVDAELIDAGVWVSVVIVGMGDVGERVDARLRGFGARLVGVRARPERDGPAGLDGIAGPAALDDPLMRHPRVLAPVPEEHR
jgi:hypothetical protein